MKQKKADSDKKVRIPKVDKENVEKISKAKTALEKYMKENKLDPAKDYSKDKKHGPVIEKYMALAKKTREKIKENTSPEKHHRKLEDKNKTKKDKPGVPAKYDYPKVKTTKGEREMTPSEKKKYRVAMRKEANPKAPKKEAPVKKNETAIGKKVKELKNKLAKEAPKKEKVVAKKAKKKND